MPAAAARASSRKPPPATRAACGSPSRSPRSRRLRQADAGRDAGHQADRPARQAGQPRSTSRTAPTSTRSSTSRCWSTARPAQRRLRRLDRRRHGHRGRRPRHARRRSSPSRSIRPTGIMPHHGRTVAKALGLTGDLAKQAEQLVRAALQGLRRQGHEPAGDQPADRHQATASCACLDAKVSFDDNALLPPSRHRGAARRDRGRPQGDRGLEVRPHLHRARRQDRLHGQRRRAWPWRPWTSSSSTAPSRRTSSMSAAAPTRRRSRRRSRSSPPTPT